MKERISWSRCTLSWDIHLLRGLLFFSLRDFLYGDTLFRLSFFDYRFPSFSSTYVTFF
jgi:hypothetical protein